MNAATTSLSVTRRRQRVRWGLAILVAAGLIFALREPILRSLAGPLIVTESLPAASGILLLGGDRRFDETADFLQRHPTGTVFLKERPAGRLERLGILPPSKELERRELTHRGVTKDQIAVVGREESFSDALTRWFQDRTDDQIIVLCDAFESRELRWRLNRELPQSIARRMTIRPLPNSAYGQSNWWRSKQGTVAFVRGWLGLILVVTQRGLQRDWQECNPELFQPATP